MLEFIESKMQDFISIVVYVWTEMVFKSFLYFAAAKYSFSPLFYYINFNVTFYMYLLAFVFALGAKITTNTPWNKTLRT